MGIRTRKLRHGVKSVQRAVVEALEERRLLVTCPPEMPDIWIKDIDATGMATVEWSNTYPADILVEAQYSTSYLSAELVWVENVGSITTPATQLTLTHGINNENYDPGVPFHFRVRASDVVCLDTEENPSSEWSTIIRTPDVSASRPKRPENLAAGTVSGGSVTLTWSGTFGSSDQVAAEWSATGVQGTYAAIGSAVSANGQTMTINNVPSSSQYFFRIKAQNVLPAVAVVERGDIRGGAAERAGEQPGGGWAQGHAGGEHDAGVWVDGAGGL